MSLNTGQVETAFSFVELLQQTDRERDELDEYFNDYPVGKEVEAAWAQTQKVLLVANATWVPRLIDSEMLVAVEAYLRDTPLIVRRNAFAGTVTFASPGVLTGLRDKVNTQRAASEQESRGQHSTVGPSVYAEILREGLVDWTVRTASPDGYEVRSCSECGKWFEPQLKLRSRFCSSECRKKFNNRRNSTDESVTQFVCGGCKQRRPLDEFAGLRFDDPQRAVTPLRMGKYTFIDEILCCLHCVRSSYPEWRRYIAPMESLSERATA
jgi:hypothetical protein